MNVAIDIQYQSALDHILSKVRSKKTDTAQDLFRELVNRTPVLTGRARASWDITYTGNYKAPLNEGIYAVPSMPKVPNTPNDVDVYNVADYIEGLNEGNSKKAPAMFVELSVYTVITRQSSGGIL